MATRDLRTPNLISSWHPIFYPSFALVLLRYPYRTWSISSAALLSFMLMLPRGQDRWNDLYWATGDGGPAGDEFNNAQDLDNLLGAMVRISVPSFEGTSEVYRIPSGNYQGRTSHT